MSRDAGSPVTTPPAASAAATVTRPYDPAEERGILVVLPHPDDESFAAGGTLARAAAAGVKTTYLCGTYGDMGRRMGRPAFTNREALRDVRTAELKDACQVLGCDVRFMGLRDKCIEFEDPDELAGRIRDVIRRLRPSTVVTFYPGYGVHPDHDALGHATVLAVRGLPREERPRLLGVAVGGENNPRWGQEGGALGAPHVVSDIRGVYRRKVAALAAHRSQTAVLFAQWEKLWDVETLEPKPGAPEPDEQTRAWRKRLTEAESFYVIDPDARTLLE